MTYKQASCWSVVIAILMAIMGCTSNSVQQHGARAVGDDMGQRPLVAYQLSWPINRAYVPGVGFMSNDDLSAYISGYQAGEVRRIAAYNAQEEQQ